MGRPGSKASSLAPGLPTTLLARRFLGGAPTPAQSRLCQHSLTGKEKKQLEMNVNKKGDLLADKNKSRQDRREAHLGAHGVQGDQRC